MKYLGPQHLRLRKYSPIPQSRRVELSDTSIPILALDPGGVTGWSLIVLRRKDFENANQEKLLTEKIKWWHGEIDCVSDELHGVYQLKKIIDDWPSAAIVCESFFIRQRAVDLSPVRIAACIEYHLWYHGRKMFWQQASQAKTTATDDRLKVWGCYTSDGGLRHARDADRHLLLFLRKCIGAQGKSLRQEVWPHIFGEK